MRTMARLAPLTLLAFLATTNVYAQTDPAEVARRCIERMNSVADACSQEMATVSRRAARRINELQEAGRPRAARRVAREAIETIDGIAENCAHRIKVISRRCRAELRELGAPDELLELVGRATRRALRQVAHAHNVAVRHVVRALIG